MASLTRRGIITGIGALIVSPAIVRVGSIMPVRVLVPLSPGDERYMMTGYIFAGNSFPLKAVRWNVMRSIHEAYYIDGSGKIQWSTLHGAELLPGSARS